jgi:hypothetical protein
MDVVLLLSPLQGYVNCPTLLLAHRQVTHIDSLVLEFTPDVPPQT